MPISYTGLNRAFSGADKIKNAVLILLDPTSSALDSLKAKTDIASGLISIGQGVGDFQKTLGSGEIAGLTCPP